MTRSAGNVILSWTTNATGYTLRSKGNFSAAVWQTNSPAPVLGGGVFTVTEPLGPNNKFYITPPAVGGEVLLAVWSDLDTSALTIASAAASAVGASSLARIT